MGEDGKAVRTRSPAQQALLFPEIGRTRPFECFRNVPNAPSELVCLDTDLMMFTLCGQKREMAFWVSITSCFCPLTYGYVALGLAIGLFIDRST